MTSFLKFAATLAAIMMPNIVLASVIIFGVYPVWVKGLGLALLLLHAVVVMMTLAGLGAVLRRLHQARDPGHVLDPETEAYIDEVLSRAGGGLS